jgi:hypothetical protein
MHVFPALQESPHLPQLEILEERFTHEFPQSANPAPQFTVHTSLTQDWPGSQALPQEPQLAISFEIFIQYLLSMLPQYKYPRLQNPQCASLTPQ